MKKAIKIDDGKYAIFHNNEFKRAVSLNELFSIKDELENINNSLDVYNNDELLLQWAKQNFYSYGDGEIVKYNEIRIAEVLELINLIEGV